MLAFDAPERNVCIVRRQSTSTPLQALALLNDIQTTEAARLLSQRMLKQPEAIDQKIIWAFRVVTSRRPTSKEMRVLKELYNEQRAFFAGDVRAADKLLNVGEAPNDPKLSAVDLAAGAVLAE